MTPQHPIMMPLGSARAEADHEMLSRAFVPTPDFTEITQSDSYNIIVGRRGIGKTALGIKCREHYLSIGRLVVHVSPRDYDVLSIQDAVRKADGTYRSIRPVMRVVWRAYLLHNVWLATEPHLAGLDNETVELLRQWASRNESLSNGLSSIADVVQHAISAPNANVASSLAQQWDVERTERKLTSLLRERGLSAVCVMDGLDEGWSADEVPTGVIGGLALAASDLRNHASGIHVLLFIGDNICQALGRLDPDYSKNIEAHLIRLAWNEDSLRAFVAARLRVSLKLGAAESDIRVWNRFVWQDLKGVSGLKYCLGLTLNHPREVVLLLNAAHLQASRSNKLIDRAIIDACAAKMSSDRYTDLIKEYASVLPGLPLFLTSLRGHEPVLTHTSLVQRLEYMRNTATGRETGSGDLVLFQSPESIINCLLRVGVLGRQVASASGTVYSHDGAIPSSLDDRALYVVHPCYRDSLEIDAAEDDDFEVEYFDGERSEAPSPAVVRQEQVRALATSLDGIPQGPAGSSAFEQWVLKVVKLLFAECLANVSLHPNKDNVSRRDVLATNLSATKFWRRLECDYQVRQVVFECKNYAQSTLPDYRQCASYAGGQYGRFVFLVVRSESEGLSSAERSWAMETWKSGTGVLVFMLPTVIFQRSVLKLSNADRVDYIERQLNRRIDDYERYYLGTRSGPR